MAPSMAMPIDMPAPAVRLIAALDHSDILALALFRQAQTLSSTNSAAASPSFGLCLSSISATTTGLHTVLSNLRTEAADDRNAVHATETSTHLEGVLSACTSALSQLNATLEKHHKTSKGDIVREEATGDSVSVNVSANISHIEKHKATLQRVLADVQRGRAAKKLAARAVDDSPRKDKITQRHEDDAALREIRMHVELIAPKVLKRCDSGFEETGDDLWVQFRTQLVKDGLSPRVIDDNSSSLRALVRSIERTSKPRANLNLTVNAAAANANISARSAPRSPMTPSHRTRAASVSTSTPKDSQSSVAASSTPSSSSQALPTRTRSRASSMRVSSTSMTTGDFKYITTEELMVLAAESPSSIVDLVSKDRRSSRSAKPKVIPIGPDQFGNPIAPTAIWTKVNRDKFTAEAFRRSSKHFEAFPEFIAVLGYIDEDELLRLIEVSNDIRQERLRYAAPSHKSVDREREREREHRERDRSHDNQDDEARRRRKEREREHRDERDRDSKSSSLSLVSRPRTSTISSSTSGRTSSPAGAHSHSHSRARASSMSVALPPPQSPASLARMKPSIVSPPASSAAISSPLPIVSTPRSPTRPKSILKNANPHDVVLDADSNPREVPSSGSSPKNSHLMELATTPRGSRGSALDYSDASSNSGSSSGSDRDRDRDRRHRSRRSDSESDSSSDASRERERERDRRGDRPRHTRKEYYTVAAGNGDANTPPSARNSVTTVARYEEPRRSSSRREAPERREGEARRRDDEPRRRDDEPRRREDEPRRRDDEYERRHRDREFRERERERDGGRERGEHRKDKRNSLMSALIGALK